MSTRPLNNATTDNIRVPVRRETLRNRTVEAGIEMESRAACEDAKEDGPVVH